MLGKTSQFECETVNAGCVFTDDVCKGTPYDCQWIDEEECKESLACSWDSFGEKCTDPGLIGDCGDLPKIEDTCNTVTGCLWTPATCDGTPSEPCSATTIESLCDTRSGCYWVPAG